MLRKLEDIKNRIDELILLNETLLKTSSKSEWIGFTVSTQMFAEYRSITLSFIESLFGDKHIYYKEFDSKVNDNAEYKCAYGKGILSAIKKDVDGGWLISVKELISAEIFSDFLEQANYLLEKKYKDPAAVMIGSVLEEHLRQLCYKNSIDVNVFDSKGKSSYIAAEELNTQLYKTNVYNINDYKGVTFWLGLRNFAAHGNYLEFTIEQVKLMYQSVLDFIARIN